MLMYYSRTLLSRRIERALACLAGTLVLSHTLAAGESPLASAQPQGAALEPAAGLTEQHDTVNVDDARVDLTFHLARGEAAMRTAAIAKRALPRVVGWFGPLAQPAMTIADVAWTARGTCQASAGHVAISSRWLQPESDSGLEREVIAGLARQPFFALGLGKDDGFVEGLARYATVRLINDALDGSHFLTERFFDGFVPHTLRSIPLSRRAWDPRPFVWQYDGSQTHLPCVPAAALASAIDSRAADVTIALLSLERAVGWPSLQSAMATLVTRWAGRTPSANDLVAIISEQRGAPPPLVVAALAGHVDVDYAIDMIATERNATGGTYRTAIRAHRTPATVASGDSSWAVPLTIRFADAAAVREQITNPGDDIHFEYDSPSAAVGASIDPDGVMLFDSNRRNNTRAIAPRLPVYGLRRLLNWLVWLQDAALTGTALV